MVTIPTTLILGAGASVHLGFPTGRDLKKIICNNLTRPKAQEMLMACGFSCHLMEAFVDAFSGSGLRSIDAFLEHRRDLLALGKCAITQALIPLENPEMLRPEKCPNNWYECLVEAVVSDSRDNMDANKLRIITFNYDRSLEQYLVTALKHIYHIPWENAEHLSKAIPILHVHGKLGGFFPDERNQRNYSVRYSFDEVKSSAEEISIVMEPNQTQLIRTAEAWMQESERIIFLGFGYHHPNLLKLGLGMKRFEKAEVVGTCVGLTASQTADITERYGIEFPHPGVQEIERFLHHLRPLNARPKRYMLRPS